MTRTSSTGTRVDVSCAAVEAFESGAVPRAGQEGVKAGRATIEGREAEDASGIDAMDVDQLGLV